MVTTARAAIASTSNASSYATGSFTPAANELLVVFVVASGTVDVAPTVTDSLGALTFTLVDTGLKNTSLDSIWLFVANQLAAASARTLTFNCPNDAATGAIVTVYGVSGMARVGAAAVRQSAHQNNQAASGTPAPAFTIAALTANTVLGCVGNSSSPAGMTPPTGWTEDTTPATDLGYSTPTTGSETVRRDTGFTGTTVTWGSTSATLFGSMIVELDATSPMAATVPGIGAVGASNLTGVGALVDTIAGIGAMGTAILAGAGALAATSAGIGAVNPALAGAGALGATIAAAATASGTLTPPSIINFDSAASGASAVNASSLTFAHTVGAGLSNSIMVIVFGYYGGAVASASGVTYAGQACTKINRWWDGTHAAAIEMWYCKAPASGANNVVITMTAGVGAGNSIQGVSVALIGVDQSTVYESANVGNATALGGVSSISRTITITNPNVWVLDIGLSGFGSAASITANAGQTQPAASPAVGSSNSDAYTSYKGPLASGTATLGFSWTPVTNAFTQYAQAGFIPAAAASGIAATIAAVGAASATLAGAGALAATEAGAATVTGQMVGAGALAATEAGAATVTGQIVGQAALSSTIAAAATLTASAGSGGSLSATASGVGAVSGVLLGAAALAGASTGAAILTSTIVGIGALVATSAGVASNTATLVGAGVLATQISGTAAITAFLSAGNSAIISAAATVAGTLLGAGALAATSAGVGAVTGQLFCSVASTISAVATLSPTLLGAGVLQSTAVGAATVAATATGAGRLLGTIAAAATLPATLAGVGGLASGLAGISTVSGTAILKGALIATLVGRGQLSGTTVVPGAYFISATIACASTLLLMVIPRQLTLAAVAGQVAVSAVAPAATLYNVPAGSVSLEVLQ